MKPSDAFESARHTRIDLGERLLKLWGIESRMNLFYTEHGFENSDHGIMRVMKVAAGARRGRAKTMNITICPHCGMKVLPKQDGTCPSCRLVIEEGLESKYVQPQENVHKGTRAKSGGDRQISKTNLQTAQRPGARRKSFALPIIFAIVAVIAIGLFVKQSGYISFFEPVYAGDWWLEYVAYEEFGDEKIQYKALATFVASSGGTTDKIPVVGQGTLEVIVPQSISLLGDCYLGMKISGPFIITGEYGSYLDLYSDILRPAFSSNIGFSFDVESTKPQMPVPSFTTIYQYSCPTKSWEDVGVLQDIIDMKGQGMMGYYTAVIGEDLVRGIEGQISGVGGMPYRCRFPAEDGAYSVLADKFRCTLRKGALPVQTATPR
jgi:hypothetical protein